MALFSQRDYRFELVPNAELQALGEDFDWRAVDSDPHFLMQPAGGEYPSGWVIVKTRLQRTDDNQPVKLYVDAGDGVREDTAIVLPVGQDGHIEELVRLPLGIRSMRWDPMELPGKLTQDPIVITSISPFKVWSILRHAGPWQALGFSAFFIRLFLRHERLYKDLSQFKTRLIAGNYQHWIKKHEITERDREAIDRHIASMPWRPLISVLVPVYNPSAGALRQAIASVQAQLYPNWELCIADDASTLPHVKKVLEAARAADPRIKIEYRRVNGHISAASNSALALAQGDFIALLDHDDMLSQDALYQVAAELNERPGTDIIYSDEDKIYSEGDRPGPPSRGDPHFKSDWNPDLLYSQNYISHLGVYRTALVRSVGGFREGLEGSQDFDLLLRCLATKDAEIRHIPAILYHWRASSGSTARSGEEKSYATQHGIKALNDYFRARGVDGMLIEPGRLPTTYHIRFPLPEPAPKISIIIPTRNQDRVLRQCIDSIKSKTTYPNYEIVVVDNQSDEAETLRYLEEIQQSGIRVLRYDQPFNYSAINNFAVERVDGEIVGLLNNDIEVITPDWLTEMASHAMRPDVGAVGAKLYYDTETIQHAGVIVGLGGVAGHSHKHLPRDNVGYFRRLCVTQNLSAVTGACLVVRRDNYLKVGGLDEENLTIAFNDVDFCLKLWASGLRNVWTPYAELYHHESVSRGPEDSPEKVARFKKEITFMTKKWGQRLRYDPYYSPMLTLEWENFTPDYRNAPRKPWVEWKNEKKKR